MSEKSEKIITQKAVIKKGDLFLVLHRSDSEKAFPSLWDFPGGRLEQNEDLEESLIREVKEETNLIITPGDILYAHQSILDGKIVEFLIYAVTTIQGEVKIGEEHQNFRWLSVDEVKQFPTMPYMDGFLKSIEDL